MAVSVQKLPSPRFAFMGVKCLGALPCPARPKVLKKATLEAMRVGMGSARWEKIHYKDGEKGGLDCAPLQSSFLSIQCTQIYGRPGKRLVDFVLPQQDLRGGGGEGGYHGPSKIPREMGQQ